MSKVSFKTLLAIFIPFILLVGFIFYLYKINTPSPALVQTSPLPAINSPPPDSKIASESSKASTDTSLELKSLLSDKVEILLPKDFEIMSEEMMKTKYPSERRPTLVYTNKEGSINIAFNHLKDKASQQQLPQFKKTFEDTFKNLYPSATWYSNEIRKINGRDVGILELITPAVDTEVYNLIAYTPLERNLLLVTFNCTKEQLNTWKSTGQTIIASLKIKSS